MVEICFCVKDVKDFDISEYPFDGYEIKADGKGFKPNIIILTKIKKMFEGKELSLHSQLSRIFSCNDKGFQEFSDAEMDVLKSEIIISKMLDIKQINFHMKETKFTESEIEKFNGVIEFAKERDVELVYENHVCSEDVIFNVLDTFPEVKFCLDMGHLNVAINTGVFNMDLKEFLEKVKERTIHVHAHNNHGKKDEHNSIDDGTFPWRMTLNVLRDNNLKKVIIENGSKEDILESKKILEEFFSKD